MPPGGGPEAPGNGDHPLRTACRRRWQRTCPRDTPPSAMGWTTASADGWSACALHRHHRSGAVESLTVDAEDPASSPCRGSRENWPRWDATAQRFAERRPNAGTAAAPSGFA